MAKAQRPRLDTSPLRRLPPVQTPTQAFLDAFPTILEQTDVEWLDLFLRLAETLLRRIRETGAYGVHNPPTPGTRRGYDFYASDPARIFILAKSLSRYSKNHGVIPDFMAPKTATQKLLVLKMFGEIPDGPPADKLLTESFVSHGLRPLLSLTRRVWISRVPELPDNDIIPPGRYYLKANFGAGNNVSVTFPLTDKQRSTLLEQVTYWFGRRHMHGFWAGEWWYRDIEPRIFLEEDLSTEGQDIVDWKFWVVAGRVQIVQVDQARSTAHVQRVYDRGFNLLSQELYYPTSDSPDPRPDRYEDMLRVAEDVARDLEFARVDFFLKGRDLFLGEITLCPFGAKRKMRSPEQDYALGATWSGTRLFPSRAPIPDLVESVMP